MPTIPKTTGQIIASNLHGCQIICDRDIERVAKQIDDSQRPTLAALEKVEEFLTFLRDDHECMVTQKAEIRLHDNIRSVRLALYAALTGADHALLIEDIDNIRAKLDTCALRRGLEEKP